MKKGLTLSVVLLIVAAALAVYGFVQKGDVDKQLTAAKAELTSIKADAETKAKELGDQVASLTEQLTAAQAAPVSADKYGLGISTSIGSLADATAEKAGTAQVNTAVCSLVLDSEGKIKSVTWDMQQTKVSFSTEGKPVDLPEQLLTKLEKGAAYGMIRASSIGKEWNEQIQAFADYCVGKTVEEVLNLPTVEGDPAHLNVEELATSVTIGLGEYLETLQKAAANAK